MGPVYYPDDGGDQCESEFTGYYDRYYDAYNAFSFCKECTVMVTATTTGYLETYAMNSYFRQEPYLSCNDTFTINEDELLSLKLNPPTALIEQYIKCSTKPLDAAFNAIGIATGWVGLLLPMVLVVVLSCVSCYYSRVIGALPPTDEEIKEADLESKLSSIIERCESVKKEADDSIFRLKSELVDARKTANLLSSDLRKIKDERDKEKEKTEGNDVLKTITFGLV